MTPQGKYYERCKANNLCPDCGKPKDRKGYRCSKCLKKHNQYNRESREFFKKQGLCASCGKVRVYGDEVHCPECRAKRANSANKCRSRHSDERRIKARAYNKKRRERLKAEGKCISCGKRVCLPTSPYCAICFQKKHDHYLKQKDYPIPRIERHSYGLCYICGEPITDSRKRYCDKCSEIYTNNLWKGKEVAN